MNRSRSILVKQRGKNRGPATLGGSATLSVPIQKSFLQWDPSVPCHQPGGSPPLTRRGVQRLKNKRGETLRSIMLTMEPALEERRTGFAASQRSDEPSLRESYYFWLSTARRGGLLTPVPVLGNASAGIDRRASEAQELDCGTDSAHLQLKQFPQPPRLYPTYRNLGVLLVVHAKLVARLKPRYHFLDPVDIHQVRAVNPPKHLAIEAGL